MKAIKIIVEEMNRQLCEDEEPVENYIPTSKLFPFFKEMNSFVNESFEPVDEYKSYAMSLVSKKPCAVINLDDTRITYDNVASCWSIFMSSNEPLRIKGSCFKNGKDRDQFIILNKSDKSTNVSGTAIDVCFVDDSSKDPNTLYPMLLSDVYRKFIAPIITSKL